MHIKLICLSHSMSLRVESILSTGLILLCILYLWSILHPNLLNLNRTIRLRPLSLSFLRHLSFALRRHLYSSRQASPPPLQTISDEGTSLFHRFFRFWHRRGRDGRWKMSLKGTAATTIRICRSGNWESHALPPLWKVWTCTLFFRARSILPIRRGCMNKYIRRFGSSDLNINNNIEIALMLAARLYFRM